MIIKLFEKTGPFAENKDIASDLRVKKLIPAIKKGETIVIDFEKIEGATQSFIHALISDLIRKFGNEVLDQIQFKSCNDTVKAIITIVTTYMQEST
jgi:L-lactate permease